MVTGFTDSTNVHGTAYSHSIPSPWWGGGGGGTVGGSQSLAKQDSMGRARWIRDQQIIFLLDAS